MAKNGFITDRDSGEMGQDKIAKFSLPFYAETFEEIFTVGFDSGKGVPETKRSWSNNGNGSYTVTISYEGYPDGKEPKKPEDTETWGCDYDWSEEPIEAHWNIIAIQKFFGGVVDDDMKIIFPKTMPEGTGVWAGLGLGGVEGGAFGNLKAGDKNPMFGQSTYISLKVKITRKYSIKEIPQSVGDNIGNIVKKIPGAPEQISRVVWNHERNWMVMPPKITQKGNAWEITQEYHLSPPKGWPEEVYEFMEK